MVAHQPLELRVKVRILAGQPIALVSKEAKDSKLASADLIEGKGLWPTASKLATQAASGR